MDETNGNVIPTQQMQAIEEMETMLWEYFQEMSVSDKPRQRTHWWRVNNKPSWALPHPMGVMAAQWVAGDRYGCRCVRTPEGEIVAVRDWDRRHEDASSRARGAVERGRAGGHVDRRSSQVADGQEREEATFMQKTLTRMLGQQGRTRIVLQGLNYGLGTLPVEQRPCW